MLPIFFVYFITGVWASPPDVSQKEIKRTDPHLLAHVLPIYPREIAKELHGDVFLWVSVNEFGKVIQAEIISGPDVFYASAMEAAYNLPFEPATQNGIPIAAKIQVYFHFAPPTQHQLEQHADDVFEMIVVHEENIDVEDSKVRMTLPEEEIARHSTKDLAEVIEQTPGVVVAGGSADSSKPIIRGHQERRLLVINDGIRHESQKWGSDHGTEIDPFAAGSISVIRGSASSRYGPDAVGGVIVVEPPKMLSQKGMQGRTQYAVSSNGKQGYEALRLDFAPNDHWSFRFQENYRRSGNLTSPHYVLGNTASEVWNTGISVQYKNWLRVNWKHHQFRSGIFYGIQSENPDDFFASITQQKPLQADQWSFGYDIDRPYQNVSHDVLSLHIEKDIDIGHLEAIYAFQINLRKEYDRVRESISGPQYDFTLRSHSFDLLYEHPQIWLGGIQVFGGLGLQSLFQENIYRGNSLIPNYRGVGGGIFGFERFSLEHSDIDIALRMDVLGRNAFLYKNDYLRHQRRDTISNDMCNYDGTEAICEHFYHGSTFSLGWLYHIVPEHLDVKLDLSTAIRFPNIDELYLIGSAPTLPVYALGNPSLRTEQTWNLTNSIGWRFHWIETEISGFFQYIENYIYFAPEWNEQGEPVYDVTIQGTFPRYSYRPTPTLLYGSDGILRLGPENRIGLEVIASLVRMKDQQNSEELIGTPPKRIYGNVIGRFPEVGPTGNIANQFRLGCQYVAKQSNVVPSKDFMAPPDAYFLFDMGVYTTISRKENKKDIEIAIVGQNITNQAFRDYSSLLRYYAEQPGRDIRVQFGFPL